MINTYEISPQSLAGLPDRPLPDFVPSRPLPELGPVSPLVGFDGIDPEKIPFCVSNDDSASYYNDLRQRVYTPEYRMATNRTALIVGEGSLIAALPFIEEDTIVLLDIEPDMSKYMQNYVMTLRRTDDRKQFLDTLGLTQEWSDPIAMHCFMMFRARLAQQIADWRDKGIDHPLDPDKPDAFKKAKEAALQKSIITWNADIASHEDMSHLGQALKSVGATITFANLTNVIPPAFQNAQQAASALAHLPFTRNAPIMTTSTRQKIELAPESHHHDVLYSMGHDEVYDIHPHFVAATGPFFGLQNLARGGRAHEPRGPVALRNTVRIRERSELHASEIGGALLRA